MNIHRFDWKIQEMHTEFWHENLSESDHLDKKVGRTSRLWIGSGLFPTVDYGVSSIQSLGSITRYL